MTGSRPPPSLDQQAERLGIDPAKAHTFGKRTVAQGHAGMIFEIHDGWWTQLLRRPRPGQRPKARYAGDPLQNPRIP